MDCCKLLKLFLLTVSLDFFILYITTRYLEIQSEKQFESSKILEAKKTHILAQIEEIQNKWYPLAHKYQQFGWDDMIRSSIKKRDEQIKKLEFQLEILEKQIAKAKIREIKIQ